jgi:agmatine deiminase
MLNTDPVSQPEPAAVKLVADWQPRWGTLLAWPSGLGQYEPDYRQLVELYRQLIACLRQHEPVVVLVPPDQLDDIDTMLGGQDDSLFLEPLLTNDIWMRDAGPISARDEHGQAVFIDGNFNGWGGKFAHEMDRLVPTVLARRWGRRQVRLPLTIEGGAIESNGHDDLLTTESVLLNPNRNNPDRAVIESELKSQFGLARIHWLPRGLSDDHTDGHIDNLARFIAPDRLVCAGPDRRHSHPDNAQLAGLATLPLSVGRPEVIELPMPLLRSKSGQHLPASYTNFHLAPGLVLLPLFGHNEDQQALSVMSALFPGHKIEGIDCRPLIEHGGTLHCISQPLLAGPTEASP